MTVANKRFKSGIQLGTSETNIITGAANTVSRVDSLVFTNTSAGTVLVTVYFYASGDAAADDTTLVKAKSLSANESWICSEAINQRLDNAAILSALSDTATAVTVACSGVEIS
jgi:hypothetical protein